MGLGFVQNAGTTSSLAIMETFLAIIFGRQDRNGPSRFLPIFACRGGPGSAARCGGGPRGTQKLIKIFFCSSEPFTKIFWKRKPRENLTKTLRKSHENAWIPIENACFLLKLRFNIVFGEKKIREEIFEYYLNRARDNNTRKDFENLYGRTWSF